MLESLISNRYDGVFLPLIRDTLGNGDTTRIKSSAPYSSDFRSKVVGTKVIVDAVNERLSNPMPEEAEEEGEKIDTFHKR